VTGWARAATLPLGALFVAAVILVVTDSIGAAGFREIAGAITQRIRERVSHDWMHASLAVGFSPHAAPRVYEGFSAWDVGHVAMLPDRLDYRGEEARFSIAREDIMQVSLAPGLPAWFRTERVLISWKRPDGLAGMFALTPSGVARISAVTRESRALHARIAGWLASPASPSPNLDQPQGRSEWLGPPPSTEVTSNDISDAITLRTMSNLCLLFAVGTLLAGFATRMPNGVSALPGTFDAFLITVLGHLTVIAPMMRIHAREVPEAPREKARAAA
jgi:hypothetical protein